MRISGRCAKCASNEVHVISMDWPRAGSNIAMSAFSNAQVDHFVCCHCGYVESYVASSEDLSRIAEKWPVVQA